MKILCIADIHGDIEKIKKAKEFARREDIKDVIILGDFPAHGQLGDLEDAKFVLDSLLNEFNLFVIPGNCDPRDLISLLDRLNINLHEKIKNIPETNVKIIGFGGSNITPFNTPFEFEEKEIYEGLNEMLSSYHDADSEDKSILITHAPPKDTKCDIVSGGLHVGSSAIKRIIEEFQPSLVLCSHVHESGRTLDEIGKTKIANIGKLSDGNMGIVGIESKKINFRMIEGKI